MPGSMLNDNMELDIAATLMWVMMTMLTHRLFLVRTKLPIWTVVNDDRRSSSGFRGHLRQLESSDSKRGNQSNPVINKIVESDVHSDNEAVQRPKSSFGDRVLCWIPISMTKSSRHQARYVARTWAKRCTLSLFVTSSRETPKTPPLFPGTIVTLDVQEGRDKLWNKTRSAFQYVYDHHFNDFDWFFKADDDTYVVVRNLIEFLSDKDPTKPVYFGCNFLYPYQNFFLHDRQQPPSKRYHGYMSGGAGYALSKEALRRFVEEGLPNREKCFGADSTMPEDLAMGVCLQNLGVTEGDSRDALGRFRFLPLPAYTFIQDAEESRKPDWFSNYSRFEMTAGHGCCSDSLIAMHNIDAEQMLMYDYLLYAVGKLPP